MSDVRTRVHEQGFLIVETDTGADCVPLDCPICELALRDRDDIRAFYRVECCRTCEMHFVQPNMGKWDPLRKKLSADDEISGIIRHI